MRACACVHRWSFLKSEKAILQMDVTDTLPHARVEDIGTLLSAQGYEVGTHFFVHSI